MLKKEKPRIFYLDFIRAIATLTIVLTHFNALFLYLPQPRPEQCILSYRIFNIYMGNWGVSLFFIISGASLYYTYEKQFNLVDFLKKRIKGIYPMWWIAYFIAASYWFLRYKTYNPWGVPSDEKWKIILSILGFDAYFEGITPVYKFIGEWFLGCIILMYFLFPLLRRIVSNKKILLISIPFIALLYWIGIYKNPTSLVPDLIVFVRIPEFIFGMIYMCYWKDKKSIKIFVVSIIVLILNTVIQPHFNQTLQTTYLGMASFMTLIYIANYLQNVKLIYYICIKTSRYSYPIFLVHHIIIYEIAAGFDLVHLSKFGAIILFLIILEITAVISYWLDQFSRRCMVYIQGSNSN